MLPKKLYQSQDRFFNLLCLIVGLLVLVPILNRFVIAHLFLDLFVAAIFIFMVYFISQNKGLVIAGLVMTVVMIASLGLQYFYPNKSIAAIGMIAGIVLIALVVANIIGYILKSDEVCREVIYSAILLYLLLALMWAFLYAFLELVDPTSFNIDLSDTKDYLAIFQYYSFVTITTLGYGDITPVTEVAQAFTVLEAVIGQLYLVVAVAWLVGMHVSKKSR